MIDQLRNKLAKRCTNYRESPTKNQGAKTTYQKKLFQWNIASLTLRQEENKQIEKIANWQLEKSNEPK